MAGAQDIHYSLADFMPTWLNPALAGAYEGTARVGGIYRDQSRGFFDQAYQTPGFYVDAPILTLGKKQKAWLGVGGLLISDRVGVAALGTTYIEGGASVHFVVDETRSSRRVVSVGLRGGVLQRSADLSGEDIILAEEQEVAVGGGGLGVGMGLERGGAGGMLNSSGIDIGFGVSLAEQLDEDRNFRVGVSGRHLTQPDYMLSTRGEAKRDLTIGAQAQYRQLLDDKYVIEPALFAQYTASQLELQVQGMVGGYLGAESDKLVKVGLGIRAPLNYVYPMVGFEYKDLRLAAAFDIATNGLQQAADGDTDFFPTGFEIAAQYIIKIYKQPKVEPVILCPQI